MSELEISLSCGLCSTKHEQKIPMPEGWDSRYRSASDEQAFCPTHAVIAQFADKQCPGCVGGWGDCPLFDAFAYSGRKRDINVNDYAKLEAGICPRRVNGTIGFNLTARGAKMEDINLSERAPDEAGKALATAIRQYVERYP